MSYGHTLKIVKQLRYHALIGVIMFTKKSGVTRSEILLLSIGAVAMLFVLGALSPHFLRILSPEHFRQVELMPSTTAPLKLRRINAAETLDFIKGCGRDTIVVHLWNSWNSCGTVLFDSLTRVLHFGSGTKLVHVCTDMSGVRQKRYSSLLAQHYCGTAPAFSLRSRASLFDLHNQQAVKQYLALLAHDSLSRHVPLLLYFNRNAKLLGWKGIS